MIPQISKLIISQILISFGLKTIISGEYFTTVWYALNPTTYKGIIAIVIGCIWFSSGIYFLNSYLKGFKIKFFEFIKLYKSTFTIYAALLIMINLLPLIDGIIHIDSFVKLQSIILLLAISIKFHKSFVKYILIKMKK